MATPFEDDDPVDGFGADGPAGRIEQVATVTAAQAGRRLDQAAAALFPEHSRSRLQQWIETGALTVDGGPGDVKRRVVGGECLRLSVAPSPAGDWLPEDLPLDVVYEDEDILVVDKPAGLVVHPAAGHEQGTLVNALLYHDPALAHLPRCGIVHRIDKDTTGLLVVARTLEAHTSLVRQLQDKSVWREYEAVANGLVMGDGKVDAPIGRHPTDRKKMAVVTGGKPAVTHYTVLRRFRAHTHLRLKLETGRTHQIRVHMAQQKHPLAGDPVYGGRVLLPPYCTEALSACLHGFSRQALHASRLGLVHPRSGEFMGWRSPLPDDMVVLLDLLAEDAAVNA
ncbi:MAG: 23S rRNA pseudouridine(1911/1915/1917) synthase RluD [Pseudomonadota bacterium]